MNTEAIISQREHSLRVFLAEMENKCISQRVVFIGDPWELLDKAAELKKILNQIPKPNPKINMYEGD